MDNLDQQVSDNDYNKITTRYQKFQKNLEIGEPIKVFDPLSKPFLNELELIREVSLDLQRKKIEDLSKAAQVAEEAAADAKKKAEEDAAQAKEAEKEDA